ncbi:hypothetical protein CRG98_002147 [Punica granatum]|uniref:DNA mismatch repair proteins mutS family domain-containing protein n=1 Tax=Punica granatum TaxID=22663 RepID=A0A2I0LA26_PUNGR|nr:hypothetical protein CRG98_002147 [Punica granatum]
MYGLGRENANEKGEFPNGHLEGKSKAVEEIHQLEIKEPVTSRSLCLLDEFGKGTLNEDGVGLLGEAINYFAMRDQPPKVLVCTHLTELLDESYLLKSENIKFYTMSVLRPEDASADIEDIVFLYRYNLPLFWIA